MCWLLSVRPLSACSPPRLPCGYSSRVAPQLLPARSLSSKPVSFRPRPTPANSTTRRSRRTWLPLQRLQCWGLWPRVCNFNAHTLKLLTGHLYAMVVSLQPSASAFQVYTEAYCFQKPHCPRNYSCIRFHLTQVSSAHGDVPTNSYFVLPPSHGKGTAISPTSEPIRAQDRRRCFWSPRGSQRQSNTWKPDRMLPSGEGAGIQGVRRRLRLQPATRAVLCGGGGRDGSPRGT